MKIHRQAQLFLPTALLVCSTAASCGSSGSEAAAPTGPPAQAANNTALAAAPAQAALTEQPVKSPASAVHLAGQRGWEQETPSNSMRAAQFRLPGQAGAADAALVVFYFGATGGTPQQNIERWIAQFEQPDGTDSASRSTSEELQLGRYAATRFELTGTYVAETTPGSGVRLHEPDWTLIALIVETPVGSFYPRLVGPRATVDYWRASFDAFARALDPQGN